MITLPLNDGSEWPVGADLARQWRELYPAVDVEQALRSMRGWLLANRTRRKTARGIERFAAAWLAREQDRGRRGCWWIWRGVLVAGVALGVPGVLGLAAVAVPEGLAEVAVGLAVAADLAADLAAARGMRGGRNGFRSRCTGSGRTIRRSSGSYRRNSWNGLNRGGRRG